MADHTDEHLLIVPPPPPPPENNVRPASGHRRSTGLALGDASQVPELRRRPFIVGYYRLEPPRACHMWCCHNELLNIWTHAAAIVFTFAQLAAWVVTWEGVFSPSDPELSLYRLGILCFFAAGLWTFAVSTQYHLKMSGTDDEFLCWMYLDQSCCLALIVIGFFAGVPMGFHCHPHLQLMYVVSSSVVCAVMALCICRIPQERWDLIAGVIFIGSGVGYLTPAVHFLVVSEQGRLLVWRKFLLQMAMTILGGCFYVSFFPERFAPGRFDLVGQSHQLWHVAIYLSIALYADVCVSVFQAVQDGSFCTAPAIVI